MAKETMGLEIPAIHCDGCLKAVAETLARCGATMVAGDPNTRRVTVTFDRDRVTRGEIATALENIGFAPTEG